MNIKWIKKVPQNDFFLSDIFPIKKPYNLVKNSSFIYEDSLPLTFKIFHHVNLHALKLYW